MTISSFADEEIHNMSDMLSRVKLEKKQIEVMVGQLEKSGRLNQEQASKVKRELASVKDEDIEEVKNIAISKFKNNK